ncbi:MAG: hypothetical protein ACLGIF_09330 [Actinomycetes bacterium]
MEISGFDDLSVALISGRPALECPSCGSVPVPLRAPTLSDFTNAALDHLAEVHRVTRWVSTELTAVAA